MKAFRRVSGTSGLNDFEFTPSENEAVIKVLASGICNTDIEITKGYAEFEGTLGHEFVGEVVESPEDAGWNGKRVWGEINVGCTTCDWCREHDSRHCPNRTVLGIINRDGCHAEYVSLPVRNLVEVDQGLSIERAVFAEPFAAAYGITEQVDVRKDTRVAVVGDGKLGILCAWALNTRADHVSLIGKHESKLALGEKGGVEGVLLKEASGMERAFDVVVEASGSESGFETAMHIVRPRGKIVLKSTFHGKPEWEAWKVVVNEVTVVGSRCGMFTPVNDLLMDQRFPLEALITEQFPLSDATSAFKRAEEKGIMKVLLRP